MWDSYPRPQLKRKSFISFNGIWNVNGEGTYVPSCMSGEKVRYKKTFMFWRSNDRVIFNIGAADQIAEVELNGKTLGIHEGGYLPFSFDITDVVREGENVLSITVTDELSLDYPYGKQKAEHGGMWYTPVSGIWKSIWMEEVPEEYISDVKITSDLKGADIILSVRNGRTGETVTDRRRIDIEEPDLWTPDNPKLYYETITYGKDSVEIYFALREISIKEVGGINRVCLNGEPVFLNGVLDQGYFKPGLFIPEDPSEYEKDILRMKQLGFNLLRKHIKVETEEFYYACDRLGMMVMQDMVNSGEYKFFRDTVLGTVGIRHDDRTREGYDRRQEFWVKHMEETIGHLYNHPSVIAYTLFNEGWGQFDSDRMYERAKGLDPTRLIDSTSGWFKQAKSDFDSEHIYFRLKRLKPGKRPLLVSECGGYTLNLTGQEKSYGYGACRNSMELTEKIRKMYEKMIIPGIEKGVCGAVYTQLSDIEDEINGLYSFDRKTCKVIPEEMKKTADLVNAVFERITE